MTLTRLFSSLFVFAVFALRLLLLIVDRDNGHNVSAQFDPRDVQQFLHENDANDPFAPARDDMAKMQRVLNDVAGKLNVPLKRIGYKCGINSLNTGPDGFSCGGRIFNAGSTILAGRDVTVIVRSARMETATVQLSLPALAPGDAASFELPHVRFAAADCSSFDIQH